MRTEKGIPKLFSVAMVGTFSTAMAFIGLPTRAEAPNGNVPQVITAPPAPLFKSNESLVHSDQYWADLRKKLKIQELKSVNNEFALRLIHIPFVRPIEVFTVAKIGDVVSLEREIWHYRGLSADKGDPKVTTQIFGKQQLQNILDWQSANDFWHLPLAYEDKSWSDGSSYLIECLDAEHPIKVTSAVNVAIYEDLYKMLSELANRPIDTKSFIPPEQVKMPHAEEYVKMQKQVDELFDFKRLMVSKKEPFLRLSKYGKESFELFLIEEACGKITLERKTVNKHTQKTENLTPKIRRNTISQADYAKAIAWLDKENFWKTPSKPPELDEKEQLMYLLECRTEKHPYHAIAKVNDKAFEPLFKILAKMLK